MRQCSVKGRSCWRLNLRYNKWFLIFGMFTSSGLSAAPAGFEGLTTLVPADITLVVNDDGMRSLPGEISGQSVRFSAKTHAELHAFLLEQYVAPDVAASLAKSLMNEVSSSSFCFGHRDTCAIDDNEVKSPQVVVVSGQNKVRVLVPSSLMVKQAQSTRFIDERISEHALVVHHDVNVGAGLDRQSYGYYGGEMVAGLTHGYLRGDVNLTTDRDNTEYDRYLYVDELSWNYLSGHWRLHMGYVSDQVDDSWNATSALDTDEKVSSVRVTLGTTSELEHQSKETAQRLYFSVPSSGRLKIKRDDGSPVLERNVSAGQQYVSYSELPRGIHDLTLTVEAGGQEIYREVRKIYNTVNATLAPGETDMLFTAGFFHSQSVFPEWVEEQLPYEEEWGNPGYLQGQVMAQVMPAWQVGGSLMNTREMHYAKVATTYQPTSWFSLNAVLGRFGSGSEYVQTSGRLGSISWSWNRFQDEAILDDESVSLEHYLYGVGDYTEWSLAWSQRVWKGNAYAYYSNFERELEFTAYQPDNWLDKEYQSNRSLTVGYSWQGPWRSTLDGNVMNTQFESDANGIGLDEWSVSLSISLPLSSSGDDYVNYNFTHQDSSTGQSQYHRATYGHRFDMPQGANLGVEVSGSGYVMDSVDIADTAVGDVTVSGGYQDNHWRGSGMMYVDTDGEYSGYGEMQTSTILSGGDWFQTRERADSYLLVKNSGEQATSLQEDGDKFLTVAQLRKNGGNGGRLPIDKKALAYPLESYKEYQVMLDDSSSDYHNRGDSFAQGSSYPGTSLLLGVDNREVRSYISVFTSVEGEPIDRVECVGEGCVSVEELTEGVFKFRVSKGLPFQLKTALNQRCFIPSPNMAERQNLGQNFCMPQFDNVDGLQLALGKDGQYYYYVGEFATLQQLEFYHQELTEQNPEAELVKKNIGKRTFLFVRSPQYLARRGVDLVRSLSAYALEEQSNPSYVYR